MQAVSVDEATKDSIKLEDTSKDTEEKIVENKEKWTFWKFMSEPANSLGEYKLQILGDEDGLNSIKSYCF